VAAFVHGPVSPVVRWLNPSGRFWRDFLVGDTPELFVAIVTVVLAKTVSTTAAWILLPVLVIAALVGSVLRGRR
jgi:hypothetical protein